MSRMHDGSERIPDGTYVRVDRKAVISKDTGDEIFPAQTFIARIVGTDMGASKYRVGARFPGWNRWLFSDGGDWAFISQVTVITEEEALAVPKEVSD